jgi:hypothetical protein
MKETLNRIYEQAIKPHAEGLAPIIGGGRVAVVVFEPALEAITPLKDLGWDGRSKFFELSERERRRFAKNSAAQGDQVTARWLNSDRDGRLLVFAHRGTLLVNVDPVAGFSLEPGSLDAQSGEN